MRRIWVKRVVAFLVALNAVQLLFFILHSSSHNGKVPLVTSSNSSFSLRQLSGKPWPHLPSFTSWAANPELDQGSCEAFFGNGFTQAFRLLDPEPRIKLSRSRSKGEKSRGAISSMLLQRMVGSWTFRKLSQVQGNDAEQMKTAQPTEQEIRSRRRLRLRDGLFQCFYSDTLQTSICEGTQMIMHPTKIKMSKGGEPLDSVIGRNEEEELPYFTSGAFTIVVPEMAERKALFNKSMLDRLIPEQSITEHTMHHLFEQIRMVPRDEVTCAQVSAPCASVSNLNWSVIASVTHVYSRRGLL